MLAEMYTPSSLTPLPHKNKRQVSQVPQLCELVIQNRTSIRIFDNLQLKLFHCPFGGNHFFHSFYMHTGLTIYTEIYTHVINAERFQSKGVVRVGVPY